MDSRCTRGEQHLDVIAHHAVVMPGLGVGRERVRVVGGELGIVGNGRGFGPSAYKMMRDRGGNLFLVPLVGALQYFGARSDR